MTGLRAASGHAPVARGGTGEALTHDSRAQALAQIVQTQREDREPPTLHAPESKPGRIVDLTAALPEPVQQARASRGEDADVPRFSPPRYDQRLAVCTGKDDCAGRAAGDRSSTYFDSGAGEDRAGGVLGVDGVGLAARAAYSAVGGPGRAGSGSPALGVGGRGGARRPCRRPTRRQGPRPRHRTPKD
ncbi:hypothetical protein ABZZ16_29685 [Streptomyces sp. NPDC006386]|uniref:hypothetical protein n=1 Tax=Streptomyces sp. NPDC006386 TaxID=3156762 RepID=UPI0033A93A93